MYKTLDTLVPDMYKLLHGDVDHVPNGDNKASSIKMWAVPYIESLVLTLTTSRDYACLISVSQHDRCGTILIKHQKKD